MALDSTKSLINKGDLAVVVGSGASGSAAVRLLTALGAKVRLVEKDKGHVSKELELYIEENGGKVVTGPHDKAHFQGARLIVTSPGVPLPSLTPYIEAVDPLSEQSPVRLIGELELALPFVQAPIIAVTGTSGKTTTVSLIAAMLEDAGKKVFLGGNIGTPLSTFVLSEQTADVCVLECSSFQLQTSVSIHPHVAMVLNLTENHLDQHKDMEEYVNAKMSIFSNQTAHDVAIFPEDIASLYKERGYKAQVRILSPSQRFGETKLVGAHNALNAEAAFLACQDLGVTEDQAKKTVSKFSPLRHRLETVDLIDGVTFVNDSKSTTVEALRVALESFTSPVWLLAGGKFKGGDLASLRPLLTEKVKKVMLFGASREIFEKEWENAVPLCYHNTMADVFLALWPQLTAGDIVLLSPATSSYDQYKNYLERGDNFCDLVRKGK